MDIETIGFDGRGIEQLGLSEYVSRVICITSYDQGVLENTAEIAENSSVVLGKLIEKLVEKDVLILDDVTDMICDFRVSDLKEK
jgi:hypothetical protein